MFITTSPFKLQQPTSMVVLSSVVFTDVNATGAGGAIYSTLRTRLTINKCFFEFCYSNGGVISHTDANLLYITGSTFQYLFVYPGTSGAPFLRASSAQLIMEDSTVDTSFNYRGDVSFFGFMNQVEFRRCHFKSIFGIVPFRFVASYNVLHEECLFEDSSALGLFQFYMSSSEGSFRHNVWKRMNTPILLAFNSGVSKVYNDTFLDCDCGLFTFWSDSTGDLDTVNVINSYKTTDGKNFGPLWCDGIYIGDGSYVEARNLNVRNFTNWTPLGGGFITSDFRGEVLVENSYFEDVHVNNDDNVGGGVYQALTNNVAGFRFKATFTGCTFKDCSANKDGGAMYSRSYDVLEIDDCSFDGCSAAGDGGAIYVTGKNSTVRFSSKKRQERAPKSNTFKGNSAGGAGGALYIDVESGSIADGMEECGSSGTTCSDNKAGTYGEHFASSVVGIDFANAPPKSFDNLKRIKVEINVVDAFGSTVLSDSESTIIATINKKYAKDGLILGAKPGQVEDGSVEMRFSLVGHIGEKVMVDLNSQAIPNTLMFESEANNCKDDEVTVDYPPNTDAFDVCIESSTVENSTVLNVFMILIGILTGITMLTALVLFVLGAISTWKETRHSFNLSTNLLVLIGIWFGGGAVFTMIPDPSDATCAILPWFWSICFVCILVPMTASLAIIVATGNKKWVNNPFLVVVVTVLLLALQLTIILVWTIQDPLELDYVQDEEDLTKQCASDSSEAYLITLYVFDGIIMLCGLVVMVLSGSRRCRRKYAGNIKSVSESMAVIGNLSMAIGDVVVVTILVMVFLNVAYDSMDARFILPTAAFLLATWVTLLLLFILPLYESHFGTPATFRSAGTDWQETQESASTNWPKTKDNGTFMMPPSPGETTREENTTTHPM
eukprot:TRINITY_DN6036_c0_g1_i2.p1 TRINITY_DN6036_c0_g1~~TRINITY_DN6036_c0_g1_i2.p1  ORF type:complete len:892 (-),score=237.38 TRINITY_DN6036_c0_g1_i2:77-2752(-)